MVLVRFFCMKNVEQDDEFYLGNHEYLGDCKNYDFLEKKFGFEPYSG